MAAPPAQRVSDPRALGSRGTGDPAVSDATGGRSIRDQLIGVHPHEVRRTRDARLAEQKRTIDDALRVISKAIQLPPTVIALNELLEHTMALPILEILTTVDVISRRLDSASTAITRFVRDARVTARHTRKLQALWEPALHVALQTADPTPTREVHAALADVARRVHALRGVGRDALAAGPALDALRRRLDRRRYEINARALIRTVDLVKLALVDLQAAGAALDKAAALME